MKLKLDEAGHVVVADGKPVFVDDGGAEIAFDALKSVQKIKELNAEAKSHRGAKEALEGKLKGFEGIENPDDARKALEFQRNAKDGEYIAAGKVEEMKAGLKRTFDEQYQATNKANAKRVKELEGQLNEFSGKYNREVVGNAFANSKFIREKLAAPLGMLQATFAGQFKVEDGKIAAYHSDGSRIMSHTGDPASFDEAFERIVNSYPDKDLILKGNPSTGTGARPSNGGGGGKRSVSRAEYNSMAPNDQRAVALDSAKGLAQIVD